MSYYNIFKMSVNKWYDDNKDIGEYQNCSFNNIRLNSLSTANTLEQTLANVTFTNETNDGSATVDLKYTKINNFVTLKIPRLEIEVITAANRDCIVNDIPLPEEIRPNNDIAFPIVYDVDGTIHSNKTIIILTSGIMCIDVETIITFPGTYDFDSLDSFNISYSLD